MDAQRGSAVRPAGRRPGCRRQRLGIRAVQTRADGGHLHRAGAGRLPESEEGLMLTIMRAQWLQLIRNPIAVLIMTGLSILMTLFIGGQTFDRIVVSVLPHQSMSTAEVD